MIIILKILPCNIGVQLKAMIKIINHRNITSYIITVIDQ